MREVGLSGWELTSEKLHFPEARKAGLIPKGSRRAGELLKQRRKNFVLCTGDVTRADPPEVLPAFGAFRIATVTLPFGIETVSGEREIRVSVAAIPVNRSD